MTDYHYQRGDTSAPEYVTAYLKFLTLPRRERTVDKCAEVLTAAGAPPRYMSELMEQTRVNYDHFAAAGLLDESNQVAEQIQEGMVRA